MGERRDACRILVGSRKQTDHLEYLAIDGKIILMRMFKKQNGGVCEVAKCIAYNGFHKLQRRFLTSCGTVSFSSTLLHGIR